MPCEASRLRCGVCAIPLWKAPSVFMSSTAMKRTFGFFRLVPEAPKRDGKAQTAAAPAVAVLRKRRRLVIMGFIYRGD